MTKKYCEDCYFMFWIDEETKDEMDCANGNAIPGIDGVPELIVSDPHNCPFYTKKELDLCMTENNNKLKIGGSDFYKGSETKKWVQRINDLL